MSDWAQTAQDYNRAVIEPSSLHSIGVEMRALNLSAPAAGAWPASNRAIYIPFVIFQPWTATNFAIFSGASSGNLDVGIYDESGNRLVSSGSTAQSGTAAFQTISIASTTLSPGVYYMAMAMNNATGTLRRYTHSIVQPISAMGVLSQSTAFPLPATATFAAAQDLFIPDLLLLSRSVV